MTVTDVSDQDTAIDVSGHDTAIDVSGHDTAIDVSGHDAVLLLPVFKIPSLPAQAGPLGSSCQTRLPNGLQKYGDQQWSCA